MSESSLAPSSESGLVSFAEPGTLVYKSELFPVVVRTKQVQPGFTRDRFVVGVDIVDDDPQVQRAALLDIPEDVYQSLEIGERVMARMYEHPDKSWQPKPPAVR